MRKLMDAEDLRGASVERLLDVAVGGGGGGDVVVGGLQTALVDLEVVYEALESVGERWASGAIHQVQTRLRVIQEIARQRASGDDR